MHTSLEQASKEVIEGEIILRTFVFPVHLHVYTIGVGKGVSYQ